jgi:hypothetical protein
MVSTMPRVAIVTSAPRIGAPVSAAMTRPRIPPDPDGAAAGVRGSRGGPWTSALTNSTSAARIVRTSEAGYPITQSLRTKHQIIAFHQISAEPVTYVRMRFNASHPGQTFMRTVRDVEPWSNNRLREECRRQVS